MTGGGCPSISGHQDPAGETPWAMQLVVRLERRDPPAATAVWAAAAQAVVTLLADDRAGPGGEWEAEVSRWLDGRIRKLARRARGAAWDRVQALPGVTVDRDGTQVRAFVPGPVDAVPADIARLQLQEFAVADDDQTPEPEPGPDWWGLVIAVNPAVDATVGKMAAQTGHAANVAWLGLDEPARQRWRAAGLPLRVIRPGAAGWERFRRDAPVVIRDAGFTEVAPGTTTTAARWAGS